MSYAASGKVVEEVVRYMLLPTPRTVGQGGESNAEYRLQNR